MASKKDIPTDEMAMNVVDLRAEMAAEG